LLLFKDRFNKFTNRNTKASYQAAIESFESFLLGTYGPEVNEGNVSRTQMIEYNNFLADNFEEERTISKNIYALRSYFKYLYKSDYIDRDPSTILESPRIKRKSPVLISKDDLDKMLDFKLNTIEDYRLKVIILLLYYTGIKATELVELLIDDIEDHSLTVCNQSEDIRIIPLNDQTVQAIDQYLQTRDELKVKSQYLLHSKKGEKLDRKSLWRILDKGIDKQLFNNRINPDTFRENYIINRLCELQYLLGYDSLATLMNYIRDNIRYMKTE